MPSPPAPPAGHQPHRADGRARHRHLPAGRHDLGLRQDPRPVPHERRRGPPAGNGALRDEHARGGPAHGELLGPHEPRGPDRERAHARPGEPAEREPDLHAARRAHGLRARRSASAARCGRSSCRPTSRRPIPTRSAAAPSARRRGGRLGHADHPPRLDQCHRGRRARRERRPDQDPDQPRARHPLREWHRAGRLPAAAVRDSRGRS